MKNESEEPPVSFVKVPLKDPAGRQCYQKGNFQEFIKQNISIYFFIAMPSLFFQMSLKIVVVFGDITSSRAETESVVRVTGGDLSLPQYPPSEKCSRERPGVSGSNGGAEGGVELHRGSGEDLPGMEQKYDVACAAEAIKLVDNETGDVNVVGGA